MYQAPRQNVFVEMTESGQRNTTSIIGNLLISIFGATG